jgi:hypothetical protein
MADAPEPVQPASIQIELTEEQQHLIRRLSGQFAKGPRAHPRPRRRRRVQGELTADDLLRDTDKRHLIADTLRSAADALGLEGHVAHLDAPDHHLDADGLYLAPTTFTSIPTTFTSTLTTSYLNLTNCDLRPTIFSP